MRIQERMSFIFSKTCLIIFLIAAIYSCKNKQESSHESPENISRDEVMAFIMTYDEAWNSRNNKAVDSLYASQYKYFTSVGGVSSRMRNLEILTADYYRLTTANRTEIEISIDGNTAIVSSRWQGNGIWKGEPFNDNQRCGLVIQRQGKQLKLLSEHCVDISGEPTF